MNSIPIVQFFRGNQPWLSLSLQQAQQFNEKVVLIGDESNRNITPHHFSYLDYNQNFQPFLNVYKHLSSNSFDFEVYCFQRFFVLHQWMLIHDQNQVFMVDSDLLIYADLTRDLYDKHLQGYETALCIPQFKNQETEYAWTASPHLSYWTRSSIRSFTQFCLITYSQHQEELQQKYNYHQKHNIPGGICDMTLLYLWQRGNPSVFNLLELAGTLVDHSINSKDDFRQNQYPLKAGIKSIAFSQGVPCAAETQQPFLALHFQGIDKPLMQIFNHEAPPQAWLRSLFYWFPSPVRFLLNVYQRILKLKIRWVSP
jgi:hypothetical protein